MRAKNKKMLLASIIVIGIVVLMIALAQGALARSDETIERIDAKIEAVIDR